MRADTRECKRSHDGHAKHDISTDAAASTPSDDREPRHAAKADASNDRFARVATTLLRESAAAGHGRDGTVYTGWLGHALVWLRVAGSPAFAASMAADGAAGRAMSEATRGVASAESVLRKAHRRDISLHMGT
jgi:hypothetical protein